MFATENLLEYFVRLMIIFLISPVHEFAHAWSAHKLGDDTAKYMGRLTLSPFAPVDILGALLIFFFGFGWARPVPINTRNFRNSKWGTVAVSLAGPGANFILALICAFVVSAMEKFVPANTLTQFLYTVVYMGVQLNVGLMVFNLIPIPPLDGSKVLMEFLPPKYRFKMYTLERYFSIILLALIFFNILTPLLSVLRGWVLTVIYFIVGLVF